MLIDTHSHLNFKAYDGDRDEVIKKTREAGVVCIDVGTKYETSKKAIELAEKYEGIFASVGMHPFHIKTDLLKLRTDESEGNFTPFGEDFNEEKYKELAKSKKVVAIGEIGLDYYYRPKGSTKKEQFKQKQKEVFIQQLDLAKDLNLPVIVHCRMAFDDVYEILRERSLRGVIHSFTGTIEEVKRFIDLGYYIGINGIIFKLNIDEAIKGCPLDKILIETDCPYLTPLPAVALAKERPEGYMRNEPSFVKYVAEKIAELKGISFGEIADITTTNAKRLFGVDQSR